MSTHGHLGKPFAAVYGQHHDAVLVQNVHGAECPAIYVKGFTVQQGGMPVPFIIGVGFHDGGAAEPFFDELFDPRTRNDVGTILFTRVELNAHSARQMCADPVKDAKQSIRRQAACEIDDGFLPFTVLIGDIFVPISSRNSLLIHVHDLLSRRFVKKGTAARSFCALTDALFNAILYDST